MEFDIENPNQLNTDVKNLISKIEHTLQEILQDKAETLYFSINNLFDYWLEFLRSAETNKSEFSETQISSAQEFLNLCNNLKTRLQEDIAQNNPAVRKSILLGFVEKFQNMVLLRTQPV